MKIIQSILSRSRVKRARKAVAAAPSPRSYSALAEEYARRGMAQKAAEVCEEGLGIFASNTLLTRLLERARRVVREERMAVLRRELVDAPRLEAFQPHPLQPFHGPAAALRGIDTAHPQPELASHVRSLSLATLDRKTPLSRQ